MMSGSPAWKPQATFAWSLLSILSWCINFTGLTDQGYDLIVWTASEIAICFTEVDIE